MTTVRLCRAVLSTSLAVAAAAGCNGAKRPPTLTPQLPQTLVVLLPDDDGATGRATVSTPAGTVDLSTSRSATEVIKNQAPGAAMIMSETDVKRLFGDALSSLPRAPHTVTVYFEFDSVALTEQSKGLVPGILNTVATFPVPEVMVVGHTDTRGTTAANFALGLKRADVVRSILENAGLDRATIDTTSLGETFLLVRTPDETAEPRNRRVEITVK